MSNKNSIEFQENFANWELANPRRWVSVDDIQTFMSEQTDQIVAAQIKSADRIVVSEDRVASGIDRVALDVERIRGGVENLGAIFEWGFTEIIWQFEQQRELLQKIVEALEAPLDTQAKELKKRAQRAYMHGLFHDALEDFLESEKKNRYDFTVHIDLGHIYLFEKKNYEKALEYYEKAVKYAEHESKNHAGYAYIHIGLIYYILKDFQKAYEATLEAIKLSPNFYEAYFRCAQYLVCLGRYDEAIQTLESAIKGDRMYCVKVWSEKDFNEIKEKLIALFKGWKKEASVKAKKEIEEAEALTKDCEDSISFYTAHARNNDIKLNKDFLAKFEKAKDVLSTAVDFSKKQSLFDQWDAISGAREARQKMLDFLHSLISGAGSAIEKAWQRQVETSSWDKNTPGYIRIFAPMCLVVGIFSLVWGLVAAPIGIFVGILLLGYFTAARVNVAERKKSELRETKAFKNKVKQDIENVQAKKEIIRENLS